MLVIVLLLLGTVIAVAPGSAPRIGPLRIVSLRVARLQDFGITGPNPMFVITTSEGPPARTTTNLTVFRVVNPTQDRMAASLTIETSNGSAWSSTPAYPVLQHSKFILPAGESEIAIEMPPGGPPWRLTANYQKQSDGWLGRLAGFATAFRLAGPVVDR